jgi:hypothetical protein
MAGLYMTNMYNAINYTLQAAMSSVFVEGQAMTVRPDGLARPEIRPRQRYANIVQVMMCNPQLVRTFRQRRKIRCDPAQHGVKFKPCGTQQFALRN